MESESKSIIEGLIKQLEFNDVRSRDIVTKCLIDLGIDIIPYIRKAIISTDSSQDIIWKGS